MKTPVKSTDPRKKKLLSAFKVIFEVDKVTNLLDLGNDNYSANCFKHVGNRKYVSLGNKKLEHLIADGVYYGLSGK